MSSYQEMSPARFLDEDGLEVLKVHPHSALSTCFNARSAKVTVGIVLKSKVQVKTLVHCFVLY